MILMSLNTGIQLAPSYAYGYCVHLQIHGVDNDDVQ